MSYSYRKLRPTVFTEDGTVALLKAKRIIERAIKAADCVAMGMLLTTRGNTWESMAIVDYLVEIGEIQEIRQERTPAGQHRIFVLKNWGM